MKELSAHINAFVDLMKRKGYTGHFLCNTSHPGKIEESLQNHLLECLQGTNHIPPFYLSTYTKWQNEESPYVKCDFKVKYNAHDGFNVVNVDVDYRNSYGSIRKKDLSIDSNGTLPEREQINNMVIAKKNRMKL